jgi:hypothetical protein
MLTGELLTLFRCVLFAREPVSAVDICGRTGQPITSIEDVLHAMRMAGDVEVAESTPAGQRWRVTERWHDARPWRGADKGHTMRQFLSGA